VLCGFEAKASGKKRGLGVVPVVNQKFEKKVRTIADKRKDTWSLDVLARLDSIGELQAAHSVYHEQCFVYFRTTKQVPKAFDKSKEERTSKRGRPSNPLMQTVFDETLKTLGDEKNRQCTLQDIQDKMKAFLLERGSETEPYSTKYIKKLLLERDCDGMIISGGAGRQPCVVSFKSTATAILQAQYQASISGGGDGSDNHMQLLHDAVKVLKEEMKTKVDDRDAYPSFDDIGSKNKNMEYLPPLLRFLLSKLIDSSTDLKIAAIGQAILQACKPRLVLAPLQVGLGVQAHHLYYICRFLLFFSLLLLLLILQYFNQWTGGTLFMNDCLVLASRPLLSPTICRCPPPTPNYTLKWSTCIQLYVINFIFVHMF
jgi:hypothetical protein